MKRRPFLFVGLASFLSAMLCTWLPLTIAAVLIVAVAVASVVAVAVCLDKGTVWRTALIATVAVAISVVFAVREVCTAQPQEALDGTVATLTMRVEEALPSTEAYLVRVESGTAANGCRLCFWPLNDNLSPRNGDLLTAEVELVAAYDRDTEYGFTAKANGVYLYAWPIESDALVWEDGSGTVSLPRNILYALRDNIHTTLYRYMGFEEAAMAQALMLGQRSNLSSAVSNAFRVSGVYHLVAVSGTHLAILSGVVMLVLRNARCSRRVTAVLTMLFVMLFMALCGFTASVTRAGVMTLIVLSGQLFRRRSDGLNSLGFAVAVMLLLDPFCLYDIGWQLSFCATLGLFCVQPVWQKEITARIVRLAPHTAPILAPVSTVVGVTVSATLATAPLTAWHFGGISTVFLLSNPVCVPLASILLVCLFAAVLTVWFLPLAQGLFCVAHLLCRVMTAYTARLASLSVSQMVTNRWMVLWLTVLVIALVYGYVRFRMRGVWWATTVMAVVLAVGSCVYTYAMRSVSVIASASSNSLAVTVKTDGTNGLILAPGSRVVKEAAMLLCDEGIRTADWVLWLGTDEQPMPDLSELSVPIRHLLVISPPEQYRSLPFAHTVTEFQSGGSLAVGDNVCVERCEEFVRVCIDGKTVCLAVTHGQADADRLPSAWRKTTWLCTGTAFEGQEDIRAQHTIVFCAHRKVATLSEAFPQAVIAIEADTQRLQVRDGDPSASDVLQTAT